jgi:uncharacterized protein (DUF1501 family)
MQRRKFITHAGILATSLITAIGRGAWVARSATPHIDQKRLIVVFLRGAVDGLSIVVPYSEPAYYQARPQIALPYPGKAGGVLDLDGRFGLHPALADIMPFWQEKSLAFVHASGSEDSTRSHFDAQQYMENGTPGIKVTKDGWMNRLLEVISQKTPIQAVSIGEITPWILSGKIPVANLSPGKNGARPIDRPLVARAFDRLYSNYDPLSQTYHEGRMARQAILQDLEEERKANNGAPLPNGFPKDAQKLAQLMVEDSRVQLGFMAIGGWDTHVNQGSVKGQLAGNLNRLGVGLSVLVDTLRPIYRDTAIIVLSEFGRTLRQNNDRGTDHGHGNVMWILGGGINGGKVHGDWPGLSPNQLYQGRDLAIATDFREVIADVLLNHLKLDQTKFNQVIPNYQFSQKISLI